MEVSPVTPIRRPPSSPIGRSEKSRTLCPRVGPTMPNGRRVTVPSSRRQSREGERAGIDPALGHGLAERAGRQRLGDGPGERVEERLDVQVRDAADPQHQLHTFTTL